MICKTCKKEIHYCDNCDFDCYKFEGYCNKYCFENSKEFKSYKNLINKFLNSLNSSQKEMFNKIYNINDLYFEYIQERINAKIN